MLLRSGITPAGPKGTKLVGERDGIKIVVVYSYVGVKLGKIKSIYPIRATRKDILRLWNRVTPQ